MIFIRPLLLLLILVPFVWRVTRRYTSIDTPWKKWVDANLLPYLLVGGKKGRTTSLWRWGLIALWSLFVIAAAGPAITKLPVPVSHSLPNTVIIFDLGPAMQGSTLASAKIKMHDLLTALKGNRVGLVLYADKGYTAIPLTEDRALIRNLISTLDPSVLPNTQQNPAAAFNRANELIQQTGGKGRIIYLTAGGIDASNIKTPYAVGVLGLDDKAVSSNLKKIGTYRAKTADASDILALLSATEPDTTLRFEGEEQTDEWADLGGLLALILLPFFALTFRRGFLFILLLAAFAPAHASFFLRPDQEAYQQQAEAVADYRAGEYDKAVQGFEKHPYNRGNALAHAGKIQEAIQSYAEALKLDPNDEDAKFNKEYLEKQLPPQDQNQQKNQDQQQSDSKDQQNQQDNANEDQQNQDQESNEEQDQPENDNQSQNKQEQQVKPEQKDQADQTQPQEVDENDREKSPFNQEEQQVLNRLRPDPYRVLRYRLLQQARKK